jgi:FKBP-type peptidyl-prolyl cis-trans isomerase
VRHPCLSWVLVLIVLAGCSRSEPSGARPAPTPAPATKPAASNEPAPASEATIPADAVTSPSGLISKVLKEGSGERRPALHDKVRVNFVARNAKGEIKDSSEQRGGPVTYDVRGVIAGWSEALQDMRVGEQRRLWVPDDLVYPGRAGYPRAMSLFDLELIEIIEGEPPRPAPAGAATMPADARKTRSGLAYKMLARGKGTLRPKPWDRVTIHYTGWSLDGIMVEGSARDRPSIFEVGMMMPGLSEAMPLLAVGDKARFWLPESLAYAGRPNEPRGTIIFDVELVAIEQRPEPPRPPATLRQPPASAKKADSGLVYQLISHGPGKVRPTATDRVEMHYSAWTSDGKLFDSSVTRGQSVTLPLRHLIAGWAEGLTYMAEGDQALFWIPESLAYKGREGAPPGTLVYRVELLKVVR